jgi:eukaryotic-like serine/threonine-protein kinase
MADRVGQQIGNYRIIRLLGEGGFAEVYLGEHLHLHTEAAIKILHAQLASDDMDQFLAEARIIARLEHPHIVRILDFGLDGKTPYLVMSYAPNGTLRQFYPRGTQIPLTSVVSTVKQAAEALHYAHSQKVVHRDVKPENMLVGRLNEILLSDFGIALVTQSSHYQRTQDVVGTVAYMSPEQIQGKPRPASDQYSLAIVVYEWLTGERPFHGSFTEIAVQHAVTPPPPLHEKIPTISPEVERVVLIALAKDPLQRFATIQAFANALEQASQLTVRNSFPLSIQSPQPLHSIEPSTQDYPPTIYPTPQIIATSPQTQWPQSTSASTRTGEISPVKRPLSRRFLLVGAIGLAALVGGSVTWLALESQKSGNSGASHLPESPTSARVSGTATSQGGPAVTPTSASPSPASSPNIRSTLILTYRGHSSYVYGVAWLNDQQHVASAGLDTTVQVWNTSSGQLFSNYHHPKSVNDVKASYNSTHIASASDDSTVQVRDAVNATLLLTYSRHSSAIYTVEWSRDSTRIVSASADRTVQIWDANNGAPLLTLRGHTDVVWAAGWSPNGQYIVSASADGTAKVWDANSGALLSNYTGHTATVRTVTWSPDGRRIATGSDDGTVHVWDASTGSRLLIYRGHTTKLRTVSWSHDGSRIVSGSRDATAQIWNPDTGQTLLTYKGHTLTVFDAQWSQDDTLIASCSTDTTVQIWRTN